MAWAGTPVQATGAVPLMAANGTTPVNTAANIRQGLLGALLGPAPGGPMAWRAGVVPTTAAGGVNTDLAVQQTASASQSVQIVAGNHVIPRSGAAGGPYVVNFASTSTLVADPASSSNPRIDVVYVQLTDAALGDSGTQGGQLAVVNGTASATPAVPSVPTNAVALGQLYRNTNVNNITTANITDVRKSACSYGGIRALLPGDLNSDPGSYIGEVTYDGVTSKLSGLRYWGADGAWHGIGERTFAQPTPAADVLHNGYLGFLNVGTVTIPDPGFSYKIQAVGECSTQCNSANPTTAAGVDAMILIGGTTYAKSRIPLVAASPNNAIPEVSLGPSPVFTGAQTVVFQMFNPNAAAYLDFQPSFFFQFRVSIVPA